MDKVDGPVLEHLKHIRSKVDQIADDVNDLKSRMSSFESSVTSGRRDILNAEAVDAHLEPGQRKEVGKKDREDRGSARNCLMTK